MTLVGVGTGAGVTLEVRGSRVSSRLCVVWVRAVYPGVERHGSVMCSDDTRESRGLQFRTRLERVLLLDSSSLSFCKLLVWLVNAGSRPPAQPLPPSRRYVCGGPRRSPVELHCQYSGTLEPITRSRDDLPPSGESSRLKTEVLCPWSSTLYRSLPFSHGRSLVSPSSGPDPLRLSSLALVWTVDDLPYRGPVGGSRVRVSRPRLPPV